MTFSDEFDLDLVRTKGNSGAVGPQGGRADISLAISTIISGSVVTGCSDECIISKTCSDGLFLHPIWQLIGQQYRCLRRLLRLCRFAYKHQEF